MISSLKQWFPNVTFSNQHLNAGTAQSSTFVWTIQMQQEYEAIKMIFRDQIRLSPFNPKKTINILTDGASSSSLKKSQMAYSPVDTEVLALKFACDASQHYLYGAEVINI